jgi:hypothetical protein
MSEKKEADRIKKQKSLMGEDEVSLASYDDDGNVKKKVVPWFMKGINLEVDSNAPVEEDQELEQISERGDLMESSEEEDPKKWTVMPKM